VSRRLVDGCALDCQPLICSKSSRFSEGIFFMDDGKYERERATQKYLGLPIFTGTFLPMFWTSEHGFWADVVSVPFCTVLFMFVALMYRRWNNEVQNIPKDLGELNPTYFQGWIIITVCIVMIKLLK
jgi:hypothetical protein